MESNNKPLASAVALAYQEEDLAPRVVAKGRGLLAEMIIERAREAGIYVHESPALVSLLMQIDLDAHIPPELYRAVAELLAWLYQLEEKDASTLKSQSE
ncbi:MAG TPA: EscU/YscU/HrcU family type III secretion system export apparatus switch protein [Burkholderiales bacterium]|nr:EscU/YscU/HrcU family type III secretion system export apparatus switch protein [Pseudomonadota bacterium]HVC48676.1 EscU/YscU/HrcU family type III secretion system export apparatus switch protein [Burkholderiales bacterium]